MTACLWGSFARRVWNDSAFCVLTYFDYNLVYLGGRNFYAMTVVQLTDAMKRLLFILILSLTLLSLAKAQPPVASKPRAGQLLDYHLIRSFTADEIGSWFKHEHIPKAIFAARDGLKVYEILYYTTHTTGKIVKVSGKLYVPQGDNKPSPLMVYNHGSQACRDMNFDGKDEQMICMAFATDGYMVLCPDYIGFGEGEGHQMLLNASTEAGATVDMLTVVTDLLPSLNIKTTKELYLTGYSQGGHACMATYRLLQQRYKDRFPVTAAYPMSGPYDVEGTVYNARRQPNENPVYLMLLFASYYESIDSLQKMGEVLVPPYNTTIPPLINGDWPEEVINSCLPDTCFKIVQPKVFEAFEKDSSAMRNYLRSNNVYDWKPESPTELCYCMHDEQVPYTNSITAYNTMKKNGSTSVSLWLAGKKFRHISCATFAVVYAKMYFDGFRRGHPTSHRPLTKRALLSIGKLFVKP